MQRQVQDSELESEAGDRLYAWIGIAVLLIILQPQSLGMESKSKQCNTKETNRFIWFCSLLLQFDEQKEFVAVERVLKVEFLDPHGQSSVRLH